MTNKITELGHMGDGVYLSWDGNGFQLAVNDHTNHVVYLEQHTLENIIRASVDKLAEEYKSSDVRNEFVQLIKGKDFDYT